MSGFTVLGQNSKTTILKSESHKLSHQFTVEAGQSVKRGQPVKLTATGTVTPWAAADGQTALIGYCFSDQAAGELVTVFLRGYTILYCLSNAAVNPGPVTWAAYDSATEVGGTTGYNKVAALGGGGANIQECWGWNLDVADGANDLVRVILKN